MASLPARPRICASANWSLPKRVGNVLTSTLRDVMISPGASESAVALRLISYHNARKARLRFKLWQRWAAELESEERKFREASSLRWPDVTLWDDLASGLKLTGSQPRTGVFDCKPAVSSESEFWMAALPKELRLGIEWRKLRLRTTRFLFV